MYMRALVPCVMGQLTTTSSACVQGHAALADAAPLKITSDATQDSPHPQQMGGHARPNTSTGSGTCYVILALSLDMV